MACSDPFWQTCLPAPPHRLRHWLAARGSLTARLRARSGSFQVVTLKQRLARPASDEAALIGLPVHRLALVREVALLCDGRPVVFAHSVLPVAALRRSWRFVVGLGNRPLGEVLFSNPRIRRAPLRFRQLDWHHPLYQPAARLLPAAPARLWARRSLFRLSGSPLLVTEVFLPDVLELPE